MERLGSKSDKVRPWKLLARHEFKPDLRNWNGKLLRQFDIVEFVQSYMSDTEFWDVVDLVEERRGEFHTEAAVSHLETLSDSEIAGFEDCMARLLHALDQPQFAFDNREEMSVDGILYARCAAVARGRRYYENVLLDPSRMPLSDDGESIPCIAAKAAKARHGSAVQIETSVTQETYRNVEAWTRL